MSRSVPSHAFRFGVFEVDLHANELYKRGIRISLQEQPFRILITLLERPGEVVSREEFRQRLWPNGTFVDFDRGLNTAVNKLREALGDVSGSPRFIETLPRKGYRFIADVEDLRDAPDDAPVAGGAARPKIRTISWVATLVLLSGVLALVTALNVARPKSELPIRSIQFTSYAGNEREPSFSPDGSQVAFSWDADRAGRSQIYIKQIAGERVLRLTSSAADDRNPVWSPDGKLIAFLRTDNPNTVDVVLIPALGGHERNIARLEAPWTPSMSELRPPLGHLAWSPDSKRLAITDAISGALGLSLLSITSGEKRRLTSPSAEWFGDFSPAFSPDGKKLAFIRAPAMSVSEVYVISLDGNFAPVGGPERVTAQNCWIVNPVWIHNGQEIAFSCGQWGAGRRLFRLGLSKGNQPQLVGSLGEDVYFIAASQSGRQFAYSREEMDWDIWRRKIGAGQHSRASIGAPQAAERFLSSTRTDCNPQYSPDGTKIAFESSRSGTSEIWVSEADGSNAYQLTSLGAPVSGFPRWSPDGKQIVFHSRPKGQADIFAIDVAGGMPRQLTDNSSDEITPSWSRDGRWIYFSSRRAGELAEIWKIPPQGGSAVRVTHAGGSVPFES